MRKRTLLHDFLKGMQQCWHLGFSLVTPFGLQLTDVLTLVVFSVTKFLVICYSSNRRLIHIVLHFPPQFVTLFSKINFMVFLLCRNVCIVEFIFLMASES